MTCHPSPRWTCTLLVRLSQALLAGTALASAPAGQAAEIIPGSFQTLHTFSAPTPLAGLIQATDGNFYGTTTGGGTYGLGTVYRLSAAGVRTTIHSFTGTDGAVPKAALLQAQNGNLYGTTSSGGVNGTGTVFRISTAGVCKTLYSFQVLTGGEFGSSDYAGTNDSGATPVAALSSGGDGYFYGSASQGGSHQNGTVFRIDPNGVFTKLHTFGDSSSDGRIPAAALLKARDGNFYGTTETDSHVGNASGTVFRLTPGGVLTTIYYIAGYANGDTPMAPLIEGSDGNLYGTTSGLHSYVVGDQNSPYRYGSIFGITRSGQQVFLCGLHDDEIAFPVAALVQTSSNTFYGTAEGGGTPGTILGVHQPAVFKVTLPASPDGTGSVTLVKGFANPESPRAALLFAGGKLYGTTVNDGSVNAVDGTAFTLTTAGEYTVLHAFRDVTGENPSAGLIQGTDGSFYGTTTNGGANGLGSIVKTTAAGEFSVLHSFAPAEGTHPYGSLLEGKDGSFYGTASLGGSQGQGTVFRMTANGGLTVLHNFSLAEGAAPLAGLIQSSDGNFYGTTSSGGSGNYGTAFKMTPAGVVTTLHVFDGVHGSSPQAALFRRSDGYFYGTTATGGPKSNGTIFRLTAAGTFNLLTTFSSAYGTPKAPLIEGSDGLLYGTTYEGGANGYGDGTVFKLDPVRTDANGTHPLTILHTISSNDAPLYAENPAAPLIRATDGKLYGTTQTGEYGTGAIYQILEDGSKYTAFMLFPRGLSPYGPTAGLVQGIDGSFYGTTRGGGGDLRGSLYKLSLYPYGEVQVASTAYTVNESAGSVSINLQRLFGAAGAISCSYATKDGTAAAGTDYTARSGTIKWAAGDTADKVITVPLIDSGTTGGANKTFTLSLTASTGGSGIGARNVATVSIAH